MAYENINIKCDNFCVGPQSGTFCTIDTTDLHTYLRVINNIGAAVLNLSLSSNIISSEIKVEYVGPTNLNSVINGLCFFTFEKVDDNTCMIKRWETDVTNSELSLKEQIVKKTVGDLKIKPKCFAVEQHTTALSRPNEYYDYIYVQDVSYINKGTILYIGPSSDMTNFGGFEKATVTNISSDILGYKVSLNKTLSYEYVIGDKVNFYNYVYVCSNEGYAGDTNKGSMIKFNAYTWSLVEVDTKAIYKRINTLKWCKSFNSIAAIINTNTLFINPYSSYVNWRSMFMNNVESDEYSYYNIYDIVFDDYSVYKLQKRISLRSPEGNRTVYQWADYNFQQDTLLNYANSININIDNRCVYGYSKTVNINGFVRDQYFTGLRDIIIGFSKQGDTYGSFVPLDGKTTSNTDGLFTIKYKTGYNYTGATVIKASSDSSSIFTGSTTIGNESNLFTSIETVPQFCKIYGKWIPEAAYNIKQRNTQYKVFLPGENTGKSPELFIKCRSFFTTPGGDWGSSTVYPGATWVGPGQVKEWLPMLYLGDGIQVDSPNGDSGAGFRSSPDITFGTFEILKHVSNFDSTNTINTLSYFLSYTDKPDIGEYIKTAIKHYNIESNCTFSQLNMAGHNYKVDGSYYDKLLVRTSVNQFVFVEEAVPKFWSSKNAINSYIWLRLRPFAFDLDPDNVSLYIREVNGNYDSGYVNVSEMVEITSFNAGNNINGIELYYKSHEDFGYESRIFVIVEVYDKAVVPNYIKIEYWFDIVPDYKAPYITNIFPSIEDTDVSVFTSIMFDIKDDGAGVNINSLELYLNSILIRQENINIIEHNINHYSITYIPIDRLYYNKPYKVLIKISDSSNSVNSRSFSFRFYTENSLGVDIRDMHPRPCERGVEKHVPVNFILLPIESEIDINTLKMQVSNMDVSPNIVPILYRT